MAGILQEITNESFKEYLNSLDRCMNGLNSVSYILDSFKFIRNNPEEGITLLQGQLNGISKNIELEMAYKLFCELIGVTYVENDKVSETIPLFPLIEAIGPLNVPLLPWQQADDNDFLIYDMEVENRYLDDLEKTKNLKTNDISKHLFSFKFDKRVITVLNEMRKYPRSREILDLYQTFLIHKDFETPKDPKNIMDLEEVLEFKKKFQNKEKLSNEEYYKFWSDSKILEDHEKKEMQSRLMADLQVEEYKPEELDLLIDGKETFFESLPKELFIAHFAAAEKNIANKGKLDFKFNINDPKWNLLQKRLKEFGNNLVGIQTLFKSTLIELNNYVKSANKKEQEIYQLCKEVESFFDLRELNKDGKFPTQREIYNCKPGGAGILKRINNSGGLIKFKKAYLNYIERKGDKKIENLSEEQLPSTSVFKITPKSISDLKNKSDNPKE